MASVHTSPAPLSAELVLGKTPSLKEPKLPGGVLYWLEQRPQEQGRTTLIIAHRLSAVRQADRILVFENGRVVEEGDHDSLMQRGGLYHKLYAHA